MPTKPRKAVPYTTARATSSEWVGIFGAIAAALMALGPFLSGAAITDPEGTGMTARVAAQVAKIPGVVVLDDSRPWLLPVGWSRSEASRAALGQRLWADLLILVDEQRDAFAYIDAQTGQELFVIREDSPDDLPRSAVVLVEELREAQQIKVPVVLVLKNPVRRRRGIFPLRPDFLADPPIHRLWSTD